MIDFALHEDVIEHAIDKCCVVTLMVSLVDHYTIYDI